CTEDTRKEILEELMEWAKDDSSRPIYWMNGMAGTGKTTIAYSFCQQLLGEQLLGASFFSSRSEDETADPARIFPTIAYQIARHSPAFSSALLVSLDKEEASGRTPLESQFQKLILNPAKASASALRQRRLTIVCDGFDECKGLKQISEILSLLITHLLELPIKIFISSRPEAEITSEFTSSDHREFVLHNVEDYFVRRDIEIFLHDRFQKIRTKKRIQELWPTKVQLEKLLDLSGLLFIYAATVCLFVGDPDIPNDTTQNALDTILSYDAKDPSSEASYKSLDVLYTGILAAAYEKSGTETTQKMLRVIVAAQTPLSRTAIAELLKLSPRGIELGKALLSLRSVISVPDDSSQPVKIFHASFPDFLFDPTRSGQKHHLAPGKSHRFLAEKCLEMLARLLTKDNICGLKDKNERASQVDIRTHIPETLDYACTNWIFHFLQTKDIGTLEQQAAQFFEERQVLHWIECMSLLGRLDVALKMLRKIEHSATVTMEARRCVSQCFDVIQEHPLEIYYSALIWLPRKSILRERFSGSRVHWEICCGLANRWEPCEHIMRATYWVTSIMFSQDGQQVVSGSHKTIQIWNVETGEKKQKLEGHSDWVRSVAFSSDGQQVVSGSRDKTIQIWNVETGEEKQKLEGHSHWVSSVAFSPDGQQVVSGSDDKTIRIWNVETGEEKQKLEGHSHWVTSVAFSPDGQQVVSGSDDKTIRIWNVETGEEKQRLEGHSDYVTSVAFSPDGQQVVSGSHDKTIRIWNVETGEEKQKLEGHSHRVRSVAFSPDGQQVVSGSGDKTIRIWNVETGKEKQKLEGHSDWVSSVAFSPDGQQVVSGSRDKTIRIWNVETGDEKQNLEGHSDYVTSVAFSLDGQKVVSGSHDKTIWIWNVETEEEKQKLEGHSHWVSSVAFSPDGQQVVSGSHDQTIRIWNVETGEEKQKLEGHSHWQVVSGSGDKTIQIWNVETGEEKQKLRGHSEWVTSVAFSPDGQQVVSGSDDKTIQIWNVETGEGKQKLEGHSHYVTSVAFSPDGQQVVSGSNDKTIRIWNVKTGEEKQKLEGHSDYVTSVAFSPDGQQVVSGSHDKTIQIWNVETGEEKQKL
ncbi:WD40 repeat-like protein, partial [Dendrothele bispora CBS 962.96]